MQFTAVRFGVTFGVAVSLGMGFPAVREARAAAGNDVGNEAVDGIGYETGFNLSFKETLGTAGAVGLVLGASTLPFYGQPGSHWMNLGYGALAGVLVGSGIWMYYRNHHPDSIGSAPGAEHPAASVVVPMTTPSIHVPLVSLTW
jgi:hypothetical protein